MSNLRDWILDHPEILVLQECRGLDLIRDSSGRVVGALLLQFHTGKFIAVTAGATLLATGGGARMYKVSSPSLEKAGDGMAMAYRVGARFVDMEMLQFHPTGLLVGASIATGGLLEEGLRGAGARLYNGLGERFMGRYSPDRVERATRDVVSRSSYLEIMAGRGTEAGGVYLDASHLGEKFLLANFPGMVERCRDYGFDLLHDKVQVSPSAHYQMGGVAIDLDCRTSVEGLFAAGEDAGGVHGANRLGGNGVADSIVFGGVAGDAMPDHLPANSSFPESRVEEMSAQWAATLTETSRDNVFSLRTAIETLMWEKVGVVRNGDGLRQAVSAIRALRERLECARTGGPAASNPAWNEAINLRNTGVVAEMVARSAIARTESRGAHFRADFPLTDPAWYRNIFLTPRGDEMDIENLPVAFTRMRPAHT
jgi:succinate dehydrogenase / fumarate reductase flavoprotein subunit/fumarate reductase flavoprotein subunit